MNTNTASIAHAYYSAMGKKNVAELEKYLHPQVQFASPFVQVAGKADVVDAIKKFTDYFNALTIRAHFGSGDQAMVVYDVEFPAPIGDVPSAALMTFQDGLIAKIELIFDARPFDKK